MKGNFAIILHAHLPYIRHPEYPDFLEEDWLFESISETYIPVLDVFDRLSRDGINFKIAMVLSPTLCEMLVDPLLQARYVEKLQALIELTEKEKMRWGGNGLMSELAEMYNFHFKRAYEVFENIYHRNILTGFKRFMEMGNLEILTTTATHTFLPLVLKREIISAHINIGIQNFRKHFGVLPAGFWLPECGYTPGVSEILRQNGIKYTIVDTHGILNGSLKPIYDVYLPIKTPGNLIVFGRDPESSRQVWSAREGYPGDPNYREFYRDLGYDADYDYIKPYLHRDGVRRNVGIKYYRVTGNVELHEKELYVPVKGKERAQVHADNFLFNREIQGEYLCSKWKKEVIILAPYDAELFGHWWFEGPMFLEFLIRSLPRHNKVRLIKPLDYLNNIQNFQVLEPSMSSWGDKGYNEMWVNGTNDWIYRHLHKAEQRIVEIVNSFRNADGILRRALNQSVREFLLASASDWAFIMTIRSSPSYAKKRFVEHIIRFTNLYDQIKSGKIDESFLSDIEGKDAIFQEMDYRAFTCPK